VSAEPPHPASAPPMASAPSSGTVVRRVNRRPAGKTVLMLKLLARFPEKTAIVH
jgi:hypothetical protein